MTRTQSKPLPVLVIYRIKNGGEEQFKPLLAKHWPTLDKLGLVSKEKPKIWKALDKRSKKVSYIESFEWKDASAPDIAHQSPEVMKVWEPMGPILENLEILGIEPVAI
jgi:hypothetical protein